MTARPTRRDMMAGTAALSLAGGHAVAASGGLRIVLLGQSLIQHDLCHQGWEGMAAFSQLFAGADACFTDLETTIIGPHGGAVTRDPALLHRADASVVDCLTAMHVNLFATANNHAFDVGTGGITDTMDALRSRGLAYAGTGINLAAARAPAMLATRHGRVALVAMSTGKIREGGAATDTRPGVFEVRQAAPGTLNEDDVLSYLASIREAAATADLVIAYNHNHYWEPVISDTPAWQKILARRCIDAGARIFVSHGAPLLQGIELYGGGAIFYDLGNFIYQSPSANEPYGPDTWRSVVADCRFDGKTLTQATLTPITLNPVGVKGLGDLETKGRPEIAHGAEAKAILGALAQTCAPLGTQLHMVKDQALIQI